MCVNHICVCSFSSVGVHCLRDCLSVFRPWSWQHLVHIRGTTALRVFLAIRDRTLPATQHTAPRTLPATGLTQSQPRVRDGGLGLRPWTFASDTGQRGNSCALRSMCFISKPWLAALHIHTWIKADTFTHDTDHRCGPDLHYVFLCSSWEKQMPVR